MLEDVAELRLERGFRIVESGRVTDIWALGALELPVELTFFDCKGEHGLNLLCPLFEVVGFTIEMLALDVMHVVDLGIAQYLVGAVFRQLVENNFIRSAAIHADARRFDNLKHLRRRIWAYYQSIALPRGTRSAIGRLSLAQIGPLAKPRLSAKAAETRNLVPLLVQLCEESFASLGERSLHLRACCVELDKFYTTMKEEPRRMTSAGFRALPSSMSKFLAHWKAYGGHLVYKHHMAWHLVQRASRHGNPRDYWTYADEQENRVMGAVAKSLHGGNTFYLTFLQKVLPEVAV